MVVTLALGATCTHAQKLNEQQVPAVVKAALTKAYPAAKDIKWDKEEGKYEASFDLNKTDHSVLFEADGKIAQTEVEIELNQLPKGVVEYIQSHYKEKAKEAAKITDANGTVTFEAEIKGKDLIFDTNGKFVKEMKD
jgi:hypothetical protein